MWFLTNRRYLSIIIAISGPDIENKDNNVLLIADLSTRPRPALNCASIWPAPTRCGNFVILRARFARSEFDTDRFEAGENSMYPGPVATFPVELCVADRIQCVRAPVLNLNNAWCGY